MVFSAFEEEETQRRGLVAVLYSLGNKFDNELDFELHRQMPLLFSWLPLRWCALHMCSNDPRLRAFKALALPLAPQSVRSRFRVHDGAYRN